MNQGPGGALGGGKAEKGRPRPPGRRRRPGPAGRGAAGGGAAEPEEGAARGGAAPSGCSGRAFQTEGGKRGGPTRTGRAGCHSRASLGAKTGLLPGAQPRRPLSPPAAPTVRPRPDLQVDGSGAQVGAGPAPV